MSIAPLRNALLKHLYKITKGNVYRAKFLNRSICLIQIMDAVIIILVPPVLIGVKRDIWRDTVFNVQSVRGILLWMKTDVVPAHRKNPYWDKTDAIPVMKMLLYSHLNGTVHLFVMYVQIGWSSQNVVAIIVIAD